MCGPNSNHQKQMHACRRFALPPLFAAIAPRRHRLTPMPPSPYAARTAIALRRHRSRRLPRSRCRHCLRHRHRKLMQLHASAAHCRRRHRRALLGPPAIPAETPPRVAARIPEVRAVSGHAVQAAEPGVCAAAAAAPRPRRRRGSGRRRRVRTLLAGRSVGEAQKAANQGGGGALGFKGGTENQGAVCYPATIRCAAAAALVLRAWAALSLGPGKRSGPAMVADRTRTAGGSCAASSASFLPRIMPGCPVKLECAAKGNKRVLEVGRQKKTPCSSHSVSDHTPLYLRGTKMQVGGGGRGRKNSRSRRPEETSTGVAYLGFV